MDVTISIINYNYGRFLKQAIDSSLGQTTSVNFEVLVIDDGSTDNSDQVIASYKNLKNFRVSKTENRGFAAALTRAIKEAQGKYVFLLDADDYFALNKLEEMLPHLLKGLLYVSDTSTYIDEKGNNIKGSAYGSTSSIAVVREAVLPLLPVENELSFFTLYKIGAGVILPQSCTFYRVHNSSMTNRSIPGKWNTYLAGVCYNLSKRLIDISMKGDERQWNVSAEKIKNTAYGFRSQSYYNKLEAALECSQFLLGYKNCILMLYWHFLTRRFISVFHLKMIVKTLIMRPSFKKR